MLIGLASCVLCLLTGSFDEGAKEWKPDRFPKPCFGKIYEAAGEFNEHWTKEDDGWKGHDTFLKEAEHSYIIPIPADGELRYSVVVESGKVLRSLLRSRSTFSKVGSNWDDEGAKLRLGQQARISVEQLVEKEIANAHFWPCKYKLIVEFSPKADFGIYIDEGKGKRFVSDRTFTVDVDGVKATVNLVCGRAEVVKDASGNWLVYSSQNSLAQVVLPLGPKLYMRDQTTCVLPKSNKPGDAPNIKSGSIYSRFKTKHKPYEIKTPMQVTGVRGTEYTIMVDKSSTIVALFEGSLSVTPNGGQSIDVKPGMMVELETGKPPVVRPISGIVSKWWLDRPMQVSASDPMEGTRLRLVQVANAAKLYFREFKVVADPSSLLNGPQDSADGWIPLIDKDSSVDLWGTPVKVRKVDNTANQIEAISAGPDKKWDTQDDLAISVAI